MKQEGGSLVGPVTAAAVILDNDLKVPVLMILKSYQVLKDMS